MSTATPDQRRYRSTPSFLHTPASAVKTARVLAKKGWAVWFIRTNALGTWDLHVQRGPNAALEILVTADQWKDTERLPLPRLRFGQRDWTIPRSVDVPAAVPGQLAWWVGKEEVE